MIGDKTLQAAAGRALQIAAGPDRQAEVVLVAHDGQLTRFANNEIHQHVAERDVAVHVRVAYGRRVGTASANGMDDETLRRVVDRASTVARLQRENPDFPGLPGPFVTAPDASGCAEDTLAAGPEVRADMAGVVCRRAQAVALTAAGACSTSLSEVAIANSLGTAGYYARTHARLLTVVSGETSSGYSMRQGRDLGSLDADAIASEAIDKAVRGREPQDLGPGEYDVVLEPYAVQDVLSFLAALGLNGRAVEEATSFATGKLGQRLLDEQITLRDDPSRAATLGRPFDFEGVPKRPVTLVDRGVVRAVTYDSLTAAKAGTRSTGHAGLGGSYYGPVATDLVLAPGALSREALIGTIERGLLVTRFWYTRTVHPLTVAVTGMTRDSTFLIEHGQVTRPVKNLRFTQSYVGALQRVIGVGADPLLVGEGYGAVLAPPVAIRGFTFTGKSDY